MAARYNSGASLDDIGLEVGCSGQKVGTVLRADGVTLRWRGGYSDALRFVPGRDRSWRPAGDGDAS